MYEKCTVLCNAVHRIFSNTVSYQHFLLYRNFYKIIPLNLVIPIEKEILFYPRFAVLKCTLTLKQSIELIGGD